MADPIRVPHDDAAKRLRLLHLLVDALGTQAETARLVGVHSSTVSQWLSGARGAPDWHVVLAAVASLLRRRPAESSRFVEFLAEDTLGVRGRWVPEPDGELAEYPVESQDVTVAHGKLTEAVRSGDPKVVAFAGSELVREAHEAAAAACRGAA